ncbi:MAG: hypothetical protein RDO_0600 [Flavobacteriales endosymbiont of Rhyzopertha dominica]|nr:MAG: 50S ribosomal protein L19 [Candidatus Shikimatogenerans bostrichidophilus]
MKKIINILKKKFIINNKKYNFNVGDNITVYYNDIYNKKNKILMYTGYVISIKGNNKFNKKFILRNIINNIGVEIIFYLYSPYINNIIINKKGYIKKSKMYYIRKKKKIKIKNIKK